MRARLTIAAICGAMLVIAGAYMGHGPTVGFPVSAESYESSRIDALEFKENLNTALLFGLIHTTIAVAISALPLHGRLTAAAAWAFLAGVILFSGVLCLRCFEQFNGAPPENALSDRIILLVPGGGVAFVAGWILFGVAVLRSTPRSAPRLD